MYTKVSLFVKYTSGARRPKEDCVCLLGSLIVLLRILNVISLIVLQLLVPNPLHDSLNVNEWSDGMT